MSVQTHSEKISQSRLVDKNHLDRCYGFNQNNWGDLSDFQGNYINFGYWRNISLDNDLTVDDRIKSSEDLYLLLLEQLSLKSNDRVLEIGCGRGNGIINIMQKYKVTSIIGLDLLEAQIERTHNNISNTLQDITKVKLIAASAENTTLESASVDKVFSVEVLQHFKNCKFFAAEMKRVLKNNGKFILAAHLSTSKDNLLLAKEEGLVIEGDELLPIQDVILDFSENDFKVSYVSIGQDVFDGYEKWVSQINGTSSSKTLYQAYKKGYIDYYLLIMTR